MVQGELDVGVRQGTCVAVLPFEPPVGRASGWCSYICSHSEPFRVTSQVLLRPALFHEILCGLVVLAC